MASKKNVSRDNIISWYMAFVLEHNHPPKSIFSFAKQNNFEEGDFYKFYGSFQGLEEAIFSAFFNNAMEVLGKSDTFEAFDARNKLLSFYFTFFEILTANRSYVMYALAKIDLKNLKALKGLKSSFTGFIKTLDIEKIDLKQEQLENIRNKSFQESSWLQLLVTMKFWMDDVSPSFEKTDIFIEKSINARFDLMDIKPLKSIIDFGKFMLKEKVKFN
jgi:hypothetical protein